jgi:aquaporin Z
MRDALRRNWVLYLIEGWGLGTLLFVTGLQAAALELASQRLQSAFPISWEMRAISAVIIGGTIVALVYSQWGGRSGAHFNPALTIAFGFLRKIRFWDAFFYILAQFGGAAIGLALAVEIARDPLMRAHDVVTEPGTRGPFVAFVAEFIMSFSIMLTVLLMSNSSRPVARYTGVTVALLVACFIVIAAPLSGTSLNPARSVASALHANDWKSIWIYLSAPPLGMLLAALTYARARGRNAVICAKLHHVPGPCLFHCGYQNVSSSLKR